ncbi:Hint domain-containing protein [Acidisoma cellulosilytica]|uniref:Hint domain-containing protein n=1 Tax=Acidisoma cellulosilyticum TaxID=2802395 RepID=A0A964E3W0_9PROT|nr:Hint domain-containing protein [Acidisoma cellulosilyticum]MCB8881055.1 Hint domain-containing protein [Acidisoma cellulosilyticum]
MTDYAWFPVTGDGESAATAYTWTIGQLPFSIGNDWANVDNDPPYPILTGTVPGAVVGGVAQDSVYLFAGAANGSFVNQFYTPDPAKGDPYIAEDSSGNYSFPTEVVLNSGSVALNTLGLESINVEDGPVSPVLEVLGSTLDIQGSIESTYDSSEFPAGLSSIVADAEEFGGFFGITVPTPGGTIDIGQTATVEVGGTIGADVDVNFAVGTGDVLKLDGVTQAAATDGIYTVGATISGFGIGAEIDLSNIASTSLNSFSYNTATGVLDINVGDPIDVMITVAGTGIGLTGGLTDASFHFGDDGSGGLAIIACYAAGTLIATTRGDIAVEALTMDDQVLTIDAGPSPVRWIGHREVNLARHAAPELVRPIRVRAGTFGQGLPLRDLYLSPDHAVFAEGVLIPVKHLANGTTIRQVDVETVSYFHIELEKHAIILAEGLPCESYLDTGDRASFGDGGAATELHPAWGSEARDVTLIMDALGCAPFRVTGPEVERAKALLGSHVDRTGEYLAA